MTGSSLRPVDEEMAADRPEKNAVRALWLEIATNYSQAYDRDQYPLFLTLSGAEGRDIQLILNDGLVEQTETGAIAASMKHRIIAVESSARAAAALQLKFPGLKVLEASFANIVSGDSLLRFPTGDHEEFCKARVVNLDLNRALRTSPGTTFDFPILRWIRKLCQIHALHEINWTLCLTLHGEVLWEPETCQAAQEFLVENFTREPQFARDCQALLGTHLYDLVNGTEVCNFAQLSRDEQQKLLMIFVPKKIAQLVHHEGWRVETAYNLRYGNTEDAAPIVTWGIHFLWEPQAFTRPDAVYRNALSQILTGAGRIAEDGRIS